MAGRNVDILQVKEIIKTTMVNKRHYYQKSCALVNQKVQDYLKNKTKQRYYRKKVLGIKRGDITSPW